MIIPVRTHIPRRLAPGDTVNVSLNTSVASSVVISPRIHMRNVGTETLTFSVTSTWAFGPGTDPLVSGSYPMVVSSGNLAPATSVTVALPCACLSSVEDEIETWSLVLASAGANVANNIVHVILEGTTDSSVGVSSITGTVLL